MASAKFLCSNPYFTLVSNIVTPLGTHGLDKRPRARPRGCADAPKIGVGTRDWTGRSQVLGLVAPPLWPPGPLSARGNPHPAAWDSQDLSVQGGSSPVNTLPSSHKAQAAGCLMPTSVPPSLLLPKNWGGITVGLGVSNWRIKPERRLSPTPTHAPRRRIAHFTRCTLPPR